MSLADIWWDDAIGWVVRWVLRGVGGFVAAWLVYAAGEANMAELALEARGDADWCASLIQPVMATAERAGREAAASQETLLAYLTFDHAVVVAGGPE